MSAEALARLQRAASYGRVVLSPHAHAEADNANVQAKDIQHAIRTATVALAQGGGKFRLEGGTDLDGERLVVVVRVVRPGLLVITVF
jgi:hypothetical protein